MSGFTVSQSGTQRQNANKTELITNKTPQNLESISKQNKERQQFSVEYENLNKLLNRHQNRND